MFYDVLCHLDLMGVVGNRETIPPKIRKSPENEKISMELGRTQGEFHQFKRTEFITNMVLMIY